MRAYPLSIIVVLLAGAGAFPLAAQTNSPAGAPANGAPPDSMAQKELAMISFLTPEEQKKYADAHAKALADNPQLKAEGDKLKEQAPTVLASDNASDRQMFMEAMRSHRQKLREAMLKEDATLQPIFVEIDKHLSELRAKQLGQVESSSGATNGSSAPPPAHP